MKTKAKKVIKITGIILLALVIVLAAYIIYLYASYHRIPDNQELQLACPVNQGQQPSGVFQSHAFMNHGQL